MQDPSATSDHTPRTPLKVLEGRKPSPLALTVQEFLLDRQARNASPGTLRFYRQKLEPFLTFLSDQGVTRPDQVTAGHVRRFLVWLQETGHNPGGQHGYFRAVKAFLRWAVAEGELEADPTGQVQAPRVPERLLEPVTLQHVERMLEACGTRTELGCRDRSLILALLDTGARVGEVIALNLGDLDPATGTLLIRQSKGRRPRAAFLEAKALKALLKYLRYREGAGPDAPLWATKTGGRLTYSALWDVLRRRAKDAGVPAPTLHAFRRSFALLSLRQGMDVYSLQRLMGHRDLQGPVYLRLGRNPSPILYHDDLDFRLGKANLVRDGNDVTLIGRGRTVAECWVAAETLAAEGVSARVLDMHTVKPIDAAAIEDAGAHTRLIVTVEDHNIIGGLGSAVAEVLAEAGLVTRLKRLGFRDTYAGIGPEPGLLDKHGLTGPRIFAQVMRLLR